MKRQRAYHSGEQLFGLYRQHMMAHEYKVAKQYLDQAVELDFPRAVYEMRYFEPQYKEVWINKATSLGCTAATYYYHTIRGTGFSGPDNDPYFKAMRTDISKDKKLKYLTMVKDQYPSVNTRIYSLTGELQPILDGMTLMDQDCWIKMLHFSSYSGRFYNPPIWFKCVYTLKKAWGRTCNTNIDRLPDDVFREFAIYHRTIAFLCIHKYRRNELPDYAALVPREIWLMIAQHMWAQRGDTNVVVPRTIKTLRLDVYFNPNHSICT